MPLNAKQHDALLAALQTRFDKHINRHSGIKWSQVQERLQSCTPAQWKSLHEMEQTGGEPDVIGRDGKTGAILYCDCSGESPAGRRSGCYDRAALESRKENRPGHSVVESAAAMGITLLDEAGYRHLQTLGEFDLKTSSWIRTPAAIRTLGGALFVIAATIRCSSTTMVRSPITRHAAFEDR